MTNFTPAVRRKLISMYLALPLMVMWAIPSVSRAETFEDLAQKLRTHPSLAAYGFAAEAATETAQGALGLPNPTISLGVNNVPISDPAFDRFLPTNKAIGVRQAIPNLKARRAASTIALRHADTVTMERDWTYARLKADLIANLASRDALKTQLLLLDERNAKYADLEEVISSEIDAGRPIAFRIADIDIERADIIRERAKLASDLIGVEAILVDLVGTVPEVNVPQQVAQSWAGQPDDMYQVRLAARMMDVSDAKIDKAKAAFGPDWSVNLTYLQREEGNGLPGSIFEGDDWFSAGVSVSIPLWSRQNQQPKLRAAKAQKAAVSSRYDDAVRKARVQWTTIQSEIAASAEIMKVLNSKIASLSDRATALITNYEAGIGDYTPILDSEIAQLKLKGQLAAEEARRESLIANANSLLVTP